MICVACFVEGPSEKVMLESLLPRILPKDQFYPKVIRFEGKQDLEKNLERRLRGWQTPDTVFLIMQDQDSGDCLQIKDTLLDKVRTAGKESQSLVRIACRELESFYLGDLQAVEQGLGISGIAGKQENAKYRNPDRLGSPKAELKSITGKKYQEVSGSRAIAPHLNIEGLNKSHSFGVLLTGIRQFA